MSSKADDMFPEGPLTEREIRDYVEENLSADERNRVERIASSNPFYADVLEGYQKTNKPVFGWEMKGRMKKQLGLGYTRFLKLLGLMFTSVFLAWISHQSSVLNDNSIKTNKQSGKRRSTHNMEEILDQELVVYAKKCTDSSVSILLSQSVTPCFQDEPFNQVIQIESLDYMQSQGFVLIDSPDNRELPRLEKSSRKIYYVVNYKVVNYRGLRDADNKAFGQKLGGVSAAFSSADEGNSILKEDEQSKVSYVKYCEQGILYFSKRRWRDAKSRFQNILRIYPNNVNALFYGGMAAYQLEEYEKAAGWFERSLNSEISTFHVESEFYLAHCYWELGAQEMAIESFDYIAEQGGFYASQAATFLKKKP